MYNIPIIIIDIIKIQLQSADYPLTATIFQSISLLQLQITEHELNPIILYLYIIILTIKQLYYSKFHEIILNLIITIHFDSFDSTEIKYPSNIEMLILILFHSYYKLP